MRLFKYLVFFLLIAQPVFAQSTNWLASYQVSNGVNQPVSTSTPLPVGVYGGSSATSGYCLTSNGPGSVATFQVCGEGGGAITIGTTIITGGTNSYIVYNNNGVVDNESLTSIGTSAGTLPVANGGTGASSQTTNGIAYYNGTAITTGTSLVYNSGNVGIGTATPQYPLDVNGVVNSATGYYLNGSSTASYGASQLLGATAGQFSIYNHSSNAAAYTTISGGGSSAAHLDLQSSYGTGTTDYIRFLTGSETEQMRITSSGAIGIGTTTISASNKLEVNGAATIGYVDIAAPTTGLIVKGNVSIGTNTNNSPLIVNSNTSGAMPSLIAANDPVFVGADGVAEITELHGFGGNLGYYAIRADGTNGSPTALASGESINAIGARGYNGSAYSATVVSIAELAAAAWVGTSEPTEIAFSTTPVGGTAQAIAVEIYPNSGVSIGTGYQGITPPTNGAIIQGNVGIGTVTPQAPLAVYGLSSGAITSDYACYDTSDGRFTYQTSNCTASLRELKDNVRLYTTGLADALALQPTTFFMKNEHNLGEEIGLIAQDTEKVNKDLAVYQDGKLRSVQYDRTGVVAIAAIQDLQREIDSLREQLQLPPRHCNVFCEVREFFEGL